VAAGTPDAELQRLALADPQVNKYLEGKTIKKVVVVNGKLVSIVAD
jgi:leucyl-tRNA synthetase